MEREHWARIQDIFHLATERPVAEREAFVAAACEGDVELAAVVMELLAEDARAQSMLDGGLADAASSVFTPEAPGLDAIQVGPYRLIRKIDEGGMGVVYLAEREDLGTHVAIKILRDAWVSPARRERFGRERRLLASLTHPSIARLYDADALPDGTPWFAMEYVDGLQLLDYCRQHVTAIPQLLDVYRQICEAVRYAHEHLIVHCDLKPSNILVTLAGQVRLLDFGIARRLSDDGVEQTRTQFRQMTPGYAAPEQLRGDTVGVRTDVYALGVILYELLAGRRPFEGVSGLPASLQAEALERAPEKPSVASRAAAPSRRVRAWADLDVLCLTAMHADPQRRYASVEALIRDVDHYLRGEPLDATPDSVRYRAGKFLGRHWRAVAAATLVVALIAGTVVFYTWRLASARDAAVSQSLRTQRLMAFVVSLFDADESDAAPSADLRVVTLVDAGVRQAKTLTAEPAIQAELYLTLGSVLERLGKYEQADELLRAALEQRRALLGPAHPDVAEALVTIGLLRLSQGKLAEAEQFVRDALQQVEPTLPSHHPIVVRVKVALGTVLEARGEYAPAIALLEEGARHYAATGNAGLELSDTLTALANSYNYNGDLEKADGLNRRILDLDRRVRGEDHPSVASGLLNLADYQLQLQRYAEAEALDRQALRIFERWYGPDHPETASAMRILALPLSRLGKLDEADELLHKALAVQERAYGPVHPRVALILNELGVLSQQRKDLPAAEAAFSRALALYRQTYPDGRHQRIGVGLANLAGVYFAKGDYARAERLFQEAVDLDAAILPADHLVTAIARLKLGRTLARLKRYRDAEPHLQAAHRVFRSQVSPPPDWLRPACEELAAVYDALEQPELARKFRQEASEVR